MLQKLSQRFSNVIKKLSGQGRLSAENIEGAAAEIRAALLEADVALPVADSFLAAVKERALGIPAGALNPGKMFAAIFHRQLAEMMGGESAALNLKKPPAVVLICGLQGAGKTTTLAKIAKRLKTREKKRVLLASTDVRRPAALEQLRQLAEAADVRCFESGQMSSALARAAGILPQARRELADAVLVDTAGRTALDEELMREISDLAALLRPAETLFTVDAMQGQDAVNVAAEFARALPLTGIVLTKFDGDSRGGAALSARAATGKPVKFVGTGEKPDDLDLFHPGRFAGRLLGMGDIAGLAELAREKTTAATAERLRRGISRPGGFDLNDQLLQLREMKKMGGVKSVLEKMPGAQNFAAAANDEKPLKMMEAAILSMTPGERAEPEIIKASRKRRIAAGAGVTVPDINRLLKQFEHARKLMKKVAQKPSAAARLMQGIFSPR